MKMRSLSTKSEKSLQSRTLSSSSTFSFIDLQCSFEILKAWIRYTKDRKSKFSLQKIWNDPQNEVNPTFHGLHIL
jgi:hypothetical protein